jgi:hypothetical protein
LHIVFCLSHKNVLAVKAVPNHRDEVSRNGTKCGRRGRIACLGMKCGTGLTVVHELARMIEEATHAKAIEKSAHENARGF